ncbi:hypothetical protein GGH95_000627 [Coemansia sp. RSA 1836]|nr:hypothetical protein GGH95_000627 [Coemansia sp. RSA 1836]
MSAFGLILLLVLLVSPSAAWVVPRQADGSVSVSEIFKIKGGLLVKNGKQTSCGLGMLDNKASLISAACLDFVKGKVDTSTKYEVFVDGGFNGATARFVIQNITVHPSYDPATKANNVALVQYNKDAEVLWFNRNAVGLSDWTGLLYTQRYLSDIEGMAWATPKVKPENSIGDTTCSKLSPVYKANTKSFTCSSVLSTAPSASLSSCDVPYQAVYAVFSEAYVYQAGFFSHVVVTEGENLCKNGGQRSYFTLISDYLTFARTELNRKVYYYNPDNGTIPQTDVDYAMTKPSGSVTGVVMLSGNMYTNQSTPSFTSALLSRTATSSETPTNNPPGEKEPSEDSGGSSGLSKRSIAIVAACSAVGSLIIAVGAFFLVRWWRGNLKRTRDPYKETAAQEILANDLGGATVPGGGGGNNYTSMLDVSYAAPPAYLANDSSRGPDVVEMPSPHSPASSIEYPNEKM